MTVLPAVIIIGGLTLYFLLCRWRRRRADRARFFHGPLPRHDQQPLTDHDENIFDQAVEAYYARDRAPRGKQ